MLEDVQTTPDSRGIGLDEVGIEGLRYPILVADGQGAKRETVATAAMSVTLGPGVKGAHLSRFIEVLHGARDQLTFATAAALAEDLRRHMGSSSARVLAFPYFLEREAPVTRSRAYVEYTCAVTATSSDADAQSVLSVEVPVTSVCPCSKAISDRGAHNQRGHITIEIKPSDLWFDELIDIAESAASSPVYALLKRPDERHVTMAGYDNPVFVEDMVRNVCLVLAASNRIATYRVRAANDESIHNHAAYAAVSWTSPNGA
ncbi:GTP cyclohydrolase FolE2 [Sphaerisporangium krabiense]|uniref:GTP cyclohydrolase FolE2 n=1 Tax=Sphaerisporangium krabiense TaxID=763782 RepID=A0A7W8Z4B5_9ACTN|nr:GTP cyclohydrolase FolE2 [Sphaerisporangium krabiense]MBB5627184.1 GTP cyclohydrolase FolE2 [Sphaerisporangium krabiense]GII65342.1 GTP cyclohydrolase FolE2 [Sphaerisporangium krabiense]